MDQSTTEPFQCPGEAHAISEAVHYARLANFHPACRDCCRQNETGTLSKSIVRRLLRHWEQSPSTDVWHAEGLSGVHLNVLDAEVARRAAQALGVYLYRTIDCQSDADSPEVEPHVLSDNQRRPRRLTVVLGDDGRPLAADLVEAASAGLRHAGCDVIDLGSVTAGCLRWAIDYSKADGGVFVGNAPSLSHTVGLKLWGGGGRPLSAGGGLDMVRTLFDERVGRPSRIAGRLRRCSVVREYVATVAPMFHALRPLVVEWETSCRPLQRMVGELTDRVACEFVSRGELETGAADRHVHSPHFGITVDGDGEICNLRDEQNRPIGCEALLPALFAHLKAEAMKSTGLTKVADARRANTASEPTVVLERDTPPVAVETITRRGGRVVLADATREAMDTAMRTSGAMLGGGPSGRYWFAAPSPTADALLLVAHVLVLMSQSDRPMSAVMEN